MQVLNVKNWKELIGSRKEWNNLLEKAKTHPELWCCRRRRRIRRIRLIYPKQLAMPLRYMAVGELKGDGDSKTHTSSAGV
jgi:hypothetical protein